MKRSVPRVFHLYFHFFFFESGKECKTSISYLAPFCTTYSPRHFVLPIPSLSASSDLDRVQNFMAYLSLWPMAMQQKSLMLRYSFPLFPFMEGATLVPLFLKSSKGKRHFAIGMTSSEFFCEALLMEGRILCWPSLAQV